ncbi:MAG: FAD-binding oxidoreductase, partial [Acetobacteraceae bacterium]|nr:FAD-binding oxidoreductase [Acetobacteraceae bacterium]
TAVLRYGPTRELVLGLEVVLPDGCVFDGLRALRKDNTGYDLKQLFIGAEGTLGIITAAVLKLFAPPKSRALAMVALPGVEQALAVLTLLRNSVGDRLGRLEIMSRGQVEVIAEHVPDVNIPFALEAAFYLLIELTDTLPDVDLRTPLENVLGEALETEVITDAILAESESQAETLWRIRHSVSEAGKRAGYVVSHDSAVPLDGQAAFITNVERRIKEAVPEARVVMHGHIGDGNIHVLAILNPDRVADAQARQELVTRINLIVDDETRALRGAISAEHGIGLSNRTRLARVTDPVEMELMRRVKAAIDPNGVMNPDKIFEPSAG